VVAKWQVASPDTVGGFSAVAHFFARRLHEVLGVPVGVLNTSWGGTIVETWTSREGLIQNPDTRAWTERYEATCQAVNDDAAEPVPPPPALPADPGNSGEAQGWAKPDLADNGWPQIELPRTWQAAGHRYSGIFWFRRAVDVPAAWAGRDLLLQIGAVDKQDITYWNGERVGATGTGFEQQHWNCPREYRVPGRLVRPGRNVIAVRAYSFVFDGGMIGPANRMLVVPAEGAGTPVKLSGAWRYAEERNFGLVTPPVQAMGPGNPNSPYMLYDNMIAPLVPYALRGAIWYQGESNADAYATYRGMMTSLIRDWRHAWGQGDFPFLVVQLANYMQPGEYQDRSAWARLRDAQFETLSEPGTGLAVAIDIGEAIDIHPKNKRDVGERLAQWALTTTYGVPGVASGPLYDGMTIERDRIRLRFRHVGGGLVAAGGPLATFAIAGQNRLFSPAKAVIEGATVVVSHPDVPEPVAVRYAWADNPEGCNLRNREGLPASPFRTDRWDM
jgi:sialate O-acetylesterase